MVENPPCYVGDVGLIPVWETKIPHATARESVCRNRRFHRDARKSPCATTETRGSKYIIFFFLNDGASYSQW